MSYLVYLIDLTFKVYMLLIAIRALLPWFRHNKGNPVIAFIYSSTDPILSPIKNGLPPMKIGMDVSPFIAIVLLWLCEQIFLTILSFA